MMIKIQKYQKYKLCMLYFPGVEGVTARQKMRFEIAKRPELSAALSAVQTNPKAKCFSYLLHSGNMSYSILYKVFYFTLHKN